MTNTIRRFMLFEAAAFLVAALFHSGILLAGYQHPEASAAEGIIAMVLLVAQSLALFGTLIGVFTIAIGVGPRTVPDVVYHIGIVIALIWGLMVAARARPDGATDTAGR